MTTVGSPAEAVRRFNRFYTRHIGVLHEKLLHSPFSLTEVRVLYELANRDRPIAADVANELGIDAGYLSRVLRAFEMRGLVRRVPVENDARQSRIGLTAKGRRTFAPLNKAATEEVQETLQRLSTDDQRDLLNAMERIERLLGYGQAGGVPYILRPPRPGDMGWVISRHGALYAREYGWNEEFEALVAEIVARFIRQFDSRRERCWIAERGGVNAGSVFLVRESDKEARLRLLLVEPAARGLGIGRRLAEECIRFARDTGYSRITLWTNDILLAARRIYERAGFRLIEEKPHHNFGRDLVGQTWLLNL